MNSERFDDLVTALGQGHGAVQRRRLLAGFAAAASGLLLPADLVEDAEATHHHPVRRVQRRKEQKREKRRKEREKRDDRGQGHDHKVGSGGLFKGIKFLAQYENLSAQAPPSSEVQFWHEPSGWKRVSTFPLANGGLQEVGTDERNAGLLIDGRYWIYAFNPAVGFPCVAVAYGGTMSIQGFEGGTYVLHCKSLDVNEGTSVTVEGREFIINRWRDEEHHKFFKVDFS